MNEKRAKEVLAAFRANLGAREVRWHKEEYLKLNGLFSIEELEALAWWRKNKSSSDEFPVS